MNLGSNKCSTCGAGLPASVIGAVTCKYCGTELKVEHDDPAVRGGLTQATRSEDTRAPVTITFVNAAAGPVDVIWLDFEGAEKGYGRIEAGQRHTFNTYVGHVWSLRAANGTVELMRWAAWDQVPRHVQVRAPASS